MEPEKPISSPSQNRSIATASVFALTILRAILAPIVIFLGIREAPNWTFAVCLILAFLSDIYDGVIARRFNVATAALRRFDSIADSAFYISITVVAWLIYPNVMNSNVVGIGLVVFLELTRYAYDLMKFGRESSYHMWSAKFWGIALFAAFLALLGFGIPDLVPVAITMGIVADLEGLTASIILQKWTHDVPSIFHAYANREAAINRSSFSLSQAPAPSNLRSP